MSEEEKVVKTGTGIVIWFDSRKGIGFIDQDDSEEDLFLHYSNIQVDGFKTVKPNQKVSYEFGSNHRGQQAVNVVLHEVLEDKE